jgi:hypothetical protein
MTFDFFRGILVACIARDAARLAVYVLPINFPWSVVAPEHKGVIALGAAVVAFYAFVLLAVLLRPSSTAKLVFWILLAIAVIETGGLVTHLLGAGWHDLNTPLMRALTIFSGPPLTAATAFLCVHKLKSDQAAEPV